MLFLIVPTDAATSRLTGPEAAAVALAFRSANHQTPPAIPEATTTTISTVIHGRRVNSRRILFMSTSVLGCSRIQCGHSPVYLCVSQEPGWRRMNGTPTSCQPNMGTPVRDPLRHKHDQPVRHTHDHQVSHTPDHRCCTRPTTGAAHARSPVPHPPNQPTRQTR